IYCTITIIVWRHNMKSESFRARFIILSVIVCISGFSQGMLLPLISFIFENRQVSATINGLHASGLYIGVLLSALFIEAPLRKYGFRPMIITGGAIVAMSLLAFPLLDSIWVWFILRLIESSEEHTSELQSRF